VVVAHDPPHGGQERDRGQDLLARHRMALDHLELGGGELAGLVEDGVGYGDLADVVEDRPVAQVAQVAAVESQLVAHRHRELGDRLGVVGGVVVLGLEGGGQRRGRAHVGLLELAIQLGGEQRAADVVGDRLHQVGVGRVERGRIAGRDLDRAPQLRAGVERDREQRAHLPRRLAGVQRVAIGVGDQHRAALAQTAGDRAVRRADAGPCLASRNALSARSISAVAWSPQPQLDRPAQAVIASPLVSGASASVSSVRSTMACALIMSVPGSSRANSSPPNRATWSCRRTAPRSSSPAVRSTVSPVRWP
jgi:hypothetical protein